MTQGEIRAICTSPARGTEKQAVPQARLVENWGIEGDAHGGDWHRQVSLLSLDKVEAFNALGANVHAGAFGENLLVSGIDFCALPVGTRLAVGELCWRPPIGSNAIAIATCSAWDCIMPREVFARAESGPVKVGDGMSVLETPRPWPR